MKASSVFKRETSTCTADNEEYQCGSACQTTCSELGQECPIVNIQCTDACYCKDGYARNENGACIPITRCPLNASTLMNIFKLG